MTWTSLRTRRARLGRAARDDRTASLPPDVQVHGVPIVLNFGVMQFGESVVIRAHPEPTHLVVGAQGHLSIGARVRLDHGVALSCEQRVSIGDDSLIGAFAMLADSDFHVAGDAGSAATPESISIGCRVVVGEHAVILPGSTIGDDVVIAPGSVVSGRVSAQTSVAGNPAVAGGRPKAAANQSVAALFAAVFDLGYVPTAQTSIDDIAEWDSLGALRLLVAYEAQYAVIVDERRVAELTSVGHWEDMLNEHRQTTNDE